jgi:DNA-binding NarL/FixJ family response regulator
MPDSDSPNGLSVFVVEDEALVAMNLEDMLFELGCTIVGPAMRIDRAEKMLSDGIEADVAILDVNVGGQMIFPFARRLAEWRARPVQSLQPDALGAVLAAAAKASPRDPRPLVFLAQVRLGADDPSGAATTG